MLACISVCFWWIRVCLRGHAPVFLSVLLCMHVWLAVRRCLCEWLCVCVCACVSVSALLYRRSVNQLLMPNSGRVTVSVGWLWRRKSATEVSTTTPTSPHISAVVEYVVVTCKNVVYVCMYVCVHGCMRECVCMYIYCVCVCVCFNHSITHSLLNHTHTHTHTHTRAQHTAHTHKHTHTCMHTE
jgi:hypothetical protein